MALVNENAEDELESLIEQIELEMRKIHTSMVKLSNNTDINDAVDPFEQAVVRNHCYSLVLSEQKINDESSRKDPVETLEEHLKKELECLSSDAEYLLQTIKDHNMIMSKIDSNVSDFKLMTEANNIETNTNRDLNVISRNIKIRFKKEKSDLKTIITTLFADNLDVQDLIAKIIEHHIDEGCDKYLQLENEDNVLEQIETLCKTNLFEVNPHDPLQIRLADLL